MQTVTDQELNYDEMAKLHLDLLKVVSDLLESPNDKSRFAYSWAASPDEVSNRNTGQKLNVGMSTY